MHFREGKQPCAHPSIIGYKLASNPTLGLYIIIDGSVCASLKRGGHFKPILLFHQEENEAPVDLKMPI